MTELTIDWPQDEYANTLFGQSLGSNLWPESGRVIDNCQVAVIRGGKNIRALFAFHNYDPHAQIVEVSGWSRARWAIPWLVYQLFWYAFDCLGCQLLVMRCSPKNVRVAAQLERWGFVRYHIPRIRGRHEGEDVFTLTDEAWRDSKLYRRYHH